jgi:hypothetical protein
MRFAEIEPVAELRPSVSLPSTTRDDDHRVLEQVTTQLVEQPGILGEALHQDLARAVERRLDVGHMGFRRLLFSPHILRGLGLRHQAGIAEQSIGQRLKTGLARHLRLGAAFLLVRQVEILEALLGFRILDFAPEFRRELALLLDRGQHRVRRSSSSRR